VNQPLIHPAGCFSASEFPALISIFYVAVRLTGVSIMFGPDRLAILTMAFLVPHVNTDIAT